MFTHGINDTTTCVRTNVDVVLKVHGDIHIPLLNDEDLSRHIPRLCLLRQWQVLDICTNQEYIGQVIQL